MSYYKIISLARKFANKYSLVKTAQQQLKLPFPEFEFSEPDLEEDTEESSEVRYGDPNYFDKVDNKNLVYDFKEWLDNTLEIKFIDLFKFFDKLNIRYSKCGNPIWGIIFKYNKTPYVLDLDRKIDDISSLLNSEETITGPSTAQNFIDNVNDVDDYVPNDPLDFWNSPQTLYHATSIENKDSILRDGIGVDSKTRGLSNRSVGAAVFTSTNPDSIDSYGDLVLEIDTVKMKKDNYMPEVGLEPDIELAEKMNTLGNMIGLEDYNYESEQGMDPDTFIIYGGIPKKYLSIYNG